MKCYNSLLWLVIILLAALFVIQTRNYERMRERYAEAARQSRATAEAESELQTLRADLAALHTQLDAGAREVALWRERCREKERVNSSVREELKRSANEIRELTAALDRAQRVSEP